jgi:hypothetical protein
MAKLELENERRLTKHAPDVWESAAFSRFFLALSFSRSQSESTLRHTRVTQTVSPFFPTEEKSMSDTNHRRIKTIDDESQPFYKIGLTLAGIILIAILAIFFTYEFIIQSPETEKVLTRLEVEFKTIAPLPNTNVVH